MLFKQRWIALFCCCVFLFECVPSNEEIQDSTHVLDSLTSRTDSLSGGKTAFFVYDSQGTPIANAFINVYDDGGFLWSFGQTDAFGTVNSCLTEEDKQILLENDKDGDYSVIVEGVFPDGSAYRYPYPYAQFFPEPDSWLGQVQIVLPVAVDNSDVPDKPHIVFYFQDPNGKPLPNKWVEATWDREIITGTFLNQFTDVNGRCVLLQNGLLVGDFRVCVYDSPDYMFESAGTMADKPPVFIGKFSIPDADTTDSYTFTIPV